MSPAKVRFKDLAESYGPPVDKLLTHGAIEEKQRLGPWPDYLAYGFTDAQVPELIRMATDLRFDQLSHQKAATWASLHAWRALGQLQAVAAVEPLLRLSAVSEDELWLPRELPIVIAMIGPAAIPVLTTHLGDESLDEFNRGTGSDCLARMALEHPEARGDCIAILTQQLECYEQNGCDLNAFIVSALIDSEATEAIEPVRTAFAKKAVDLMMCGDIEDVEIAMGLRSERSTPPPNLNPFGDLPGLDPLTAARQQLATMPVHRPVKPGRNNPCPCGSGKKYKKCCLERDGL